MLSACACGRFIGFYLSLLRVCYQAHRPSEMTAYLLPVVIGEMTCHNTALLQLGWGILMPK